MISSLTHGLFRGDFFKTFFLVIFFIFLSFFFLIYSWESHTERGRDTDRGRSRLHARSPMWDSNPGIQDHALSQRQALNHWATQASLVLIFNKISSYAKNLTYMPQFFELFSDYLWTRVWSVIQYVLGTSKTC